MQSRRISNLAALGFLSVLVSSCGSNFEESHASLRSFAPKGAMAIESEGSSARILVSLFDEQKDPVLCVGDLADCIKGNAKQIRLIKTNMKYSRSEESINLQKNLNLHVIVSDTDGLKSVLSAVIKSKTDLGNDNTSDLQPPADLPAMRAVPGVSIAYDYQGVLSRVSGTSAVVRMVIQGGALKDAKNIQMRAKLVNLRNTASTSNVMKDAVVRENGIIDLTFAGLEPDTVYRLENLSLVDMDNAGSTQKVNDSYYMMTAAENRLAKAKRLVAMQAVSESYDWDHGNYNSSKGYTVGAWCDYFYTWALSSQFKIGRGYSSTGFFRSYGALKDGQGIHELGKTTSLTGDLVRYEGTSEGTHTFMILSYDTATGKLWTVEGNFNRRVMRNQRNINSPWMHGHLTESQLR